MIPSRLQTTLRLLVGLLVLVSFWLLQLYQYQVFHLFAEGFSIVVSFTLFLLVLNVRHLVASASLLFLGFASGLVGLVDFLHVIAFPSMRLFPGYDLNTATQFWILARGLEALGFVVAFSLWERPWTRVFSFTLVALTVVTAISIVLIFARQFPVLFVEGRGLTPLKVGLEFLYIALLLVCLGLAYHRRGRMQRPEVLLLSGALGTAIAAEVCFTLYVGPTDFFNVLGHFFKLVTYYLLYRVLLRHGLLAPYEGIFRQLQLAKSGLEAMVEARTRALQSSSRRFQAILEAAPWPLILLSLCEGRVVCSEGNPSAKDLFGADSDGRDFGELVERAGVSAPDHLVESVQSYCLNRTANLPLEARIGAGEGKRTFEITLYPVDSGSVVAVFADVTSHRRALEAYQLQDQVFQLSRDLIVVLDGNGILRMHNPAWTRVLELSAFDLVRRPWLELIHEDDRPLAEAAFGNVGKDSGSTLEVRMLGANGLVRSIAWNFHPSMDQRLVYGVGRDVTNDRATERMLQQASKLESLGVVAGGIAHDFNNMLSGMFGFVELARLHNRAQRPEAVETALARSLQVFDRAKGLTRQLLAVSKGGTGVPVVLDLGPVVRQAADFVLAGSSCSVEWQLDPVVGPCEVDSDQVFQAFQNLFLNAMQAMGGAGTIRVRSRREGGFLIIEVEDEGPGIPFDLRHRVFEPFFSNKSQGTGLGLSIVASMATKHGGRVEVVSGVGQGACFALWLPVSPLAPTVTPAPREGTSTRPFHVLLMEDDVDIRSFLETALLSWGHRVVATSEGHEAVAEARRALGTNQPFEVALLDWTVRRGLGGEGTLAALKTLDPTIRVIVSTGYAAHLPAARGYDAVLAKPFRLEELRQCLTSLG